MKGTLIVKGRIVLNSLEFMTGFCLICMSFSLLPCGIEKTHKLKHHLAQGGEKRKNFFGKWVGSNEVGVGLSTRPNRHRPTTFMN